MEYILRVTYLKYYACTLMYVNVTAKYRKGVSTVSQKGYILSEDSTLSGKVKFQKTQYTI